MRTTIEALLAQRALARDNREWAEADRIRRELDEKYHVVVKDTPQGATWSVRE
jgi:cysteinyl-tRNA synthetase